MDLRHHRQPHHPKRPRHHQHRLDLHHRRRHHLLHHRQTHQLRQITATGPKAGTATRSFCYDPAGNTIKRSTETGAVQDLTWDVEGPPPRRQSQRRHHRRLHLRHRRPTPDRHRNQRHQHHLHPLPTRRHRTAKVNAANPLGRRYYGSGAVRDAAGGGLKWLTGTAQGSNTFQIDPTTNTISAPRRYLPYGEPRTTQPAGWIGTHGYINGTTDTTTGLTHLGAREYDPTAGRFTAVDPLMSLGTRSNGTPTPMPPTPRSLEATHPG
jgi:RHS repeat-associated protein